jgi:hypothetical protein
MSVSILGETFVGGLLNVDDVEGFWDECLNGLHKTHFTIVQLSFGTGSVGNAGGIQYLIGCPLIASSGSS